MRRCIFVIGTRAQLVKIAPLLSLAVKTGLPHLVWFTGQHRETIDDLKGDFGIESKFVYPDRQKEHSSVLGLVAWLPGTFLRCRSYIRDVRADSGRAPLVVVHGDTLSTFLGAMAARTVRAPVVHLESGLSSERLLEPFPEEILRRLTFRLCDYALCPNDEAYQRMRNRRGVEAIHTGENTLLDCVRFALRKADVEAGPGTHFVASIHRFRNIYRKDTLKSIVDELVLVSSEGPLYFVLHPSTVQRLRAYGLYESLATAPGVRMSERMPYTKFLALIGTARAVFSDGGSNQEELSYLGVPTVLFRERSERPDGIGANVVFRHDLESGLLEFMKSGALDSLRKPSRLADSVQPSQLSVDALRDWATA